MRPLLIAVLALCLTSCAGQRARDNVLVPAMEAAWVGVRADAERGGTVSAGQLDTFQTALQDRDRLTIVSAWPPIHSSAATGIARQVEGREIGPGVAVSKRERLRNFHEAVGTIAERVR